jgi:hypothetical protein
MPLLTAEGHYWGMTREQSLALDAREAIIQEQFDTIIKNNKNDFLKTIRLLYQFNRMKCIQWVDETYCEEQSDNNTDFWKYCVRQYLYNPAYLSNQQDVENTEAWLEYQLVDYVDTYFGYYSSLEELLQVSVLTWDWLSSYELKLLKGKIVDNDDE